MAMKIEFAKHCMIELQRSAPLPICKSITYLNLPAFEGDSYSFAAVGPLTEAWKSIPPSSTYGFAFGPASVGGPKGKFVVFAKSTGHWTPLGFFKAMVGAIIMFAGASSVAIAGDNVDHVAVQSDAKKLLTTNLSREASVRIIALNEERPRIRFSASGLPTGLSIHPLTGVISGVIDREASRNGGSPYVVKVVVSNGTSASGVSTIGIIVENRPPVLVDDVLHRSSNPTQLNVLANDADPNGDRLIITDMAASHGAVAFTPSGIAAYVPNPDHRGADTIIYRADDGHGGSATGKILVMTK